jgi:hypothetical protein
MYQTDVSLFAKILLKKKAKYFYKFSFYLNSLLPLDGRCTRYKIMW